ncbi:MAG: hypothetical protein ACFFEO_12855, partial [Candidatus Thorarchaeota archaeon]
MIFQGLFNILNLYFNNIELFYNNINRQVQEKIKDNFGNNPIDKDKLNSIVNEICSFLKMYFVDLGFDQEELDKKFMDPFLEIRDEEKANFSVISDIYQSKIAPIVYEIFLLKIIDYLADFEVTPLFLKIKDEGFLPIEFIVELRNLKTLFERVPNKIENLRKYIQVQKRIFSTFKDEKEKIENLETIEEPQYKLQLVYLIYRIIDFFNLQKMFNFSQIKSYLSENVEDWLIDVPFVSLRNPDIYFCGIYLSKHLNVKFNAEIVKTFLLDLYETAVDRYEAPLIEATDGAYYYFKSTILMKLRLNDEQVKKIIKADVKYFESTYLRTLETSQLVVILKIYNILGVSGMDDEKNAIFDEIEKRISPDGIRQYRDGFISSEAIYYVIFVHYMQNILEKLKEYNFLDHIISRIYRNLELLDFSIDTNYDLLSELFYSFESLKLFNYVETSQMIVHLAKYLFPDPVVNKILSIEEITQINTKFRHLKVDRNTGET